ncbi:hypothetical protein LRQ09_11345 [Acinetobacter soli]|uniref:hypothetical protein n=1 Tax=Acinetobacter soli TaxID=487316 RepID=UPI001F36236F|nr:hypothetical protein [Acinetobacter soli]MCF3127962.1 hypothetical protein [Acinetobacter soli]
MSKKKFSKKRFYRRLIAQNSGCVDSGNIGKCLPVGFDWKAFQEATKKIALVFKQMCEKMNCRVATKVKI